MEKVEYIEQAVETAEHSFYCDECNKYLGTIKEYDDGWYETLGEFELSFYIDGYWYEVKKCLCHDCANNFLSNLKNSLKDMRFKKN